MHPLNFDKQMRQAKLPVRVDYWKVWCERCNGLHVGPNGICRLMLPILSL